MAASKKCRNTGISAEHGPGPNAAAQKEREQQQADGLHAPGGNPELGGMVRSQVVDKDAHAFVRKGVDQIEKTHGKIGDAQKQQGVVLLQSPGVPEQEEHAPGHGHGEKFRQSVKQQVVVAADDEQYQQEDQSSYGLQDSIGLCRFYIHGIPPLPVSIVRRFCGGGAVFIVVLLACFSNGHHPALGVRFEPILNRSPVSSKSPPVPLIWLFYG